MDFDVIIVGAGIAGLTSTAFLSKAGYTTLLCEKENHCGGLIGSFERDGFVFDWGIRSTENSGTVFPMLRSLGIDVEFVKSNVSLGIEDQILRIQSEKNLDDYQALLSSLYPANEAEIGEIIKVIRKIMGHIEILYGIDNPAFLDIEKDRKYLLKVILPWVFKYMMTIGKIQALNAPVVDFLRQYTQNQSLLDIIAQHFFRDTPAFFALSYFKLYLDYYYPVGGTGKLIEKMVDFIHDHQGTIMTNTEIISIDPERKTVTDKEGQTYKYKRLIWAADLKTLYNRINSPAVENINTKRSIEERRVDLADKIGGDSVFTLYLTLNLDKSYFASRASEHFFYTPTRVGQSSAGDLPLTADQEDIEAWLKAYYALTTYEISCPVMRDATLAPAGKTGLIVSVLFDYTLTKHIQESGWYEAFKIYSENCIVDTLDATVFPGLKEAIIDKFSYTPLSIARITGNSDGAITGWAFTNSSIPVESRLPKILNSVRTPIPDINQAGQWSFSPTGLPTSVITGKLAADQAIKGLKRLSRKR